jgi:hypothetical protein
MSFMTMDINAPRAKNDKPVEQASVSEVPEYTAVANHQRVGQEDGSFDETVVVAKLVNAFIRLISDFGAPIAVQESFRGGATKFLMCGDEIEYWRRGKNLLCFFKAKFLKNPLPDILGYQFVGAWKRWALSRMKFSRKNVSLWSSVFKLKNAAARLTAGAKVVTMIKHAASVGKKMESDKPVIEKCVRTIFPLLEKAARKIAGDFYNGSWDRPFAASNKACVESGQKDFGQIGHFMERVFGPGAPLVVPGVAFCGFGPQLRAQGCAVVEEVFDDSGHQRRLSYAEREELPQVKSVHFYEAIVVDGVQYENCWFETYYFPSAEAVWMNEIFIDSLIACDRDLALAKVACVLEPFKVRIITKGEAALQYMSGFFQKSVFEFNKTVPCFGLVGRAPSTFDLIDIRESCGLGDPDSAFGPISWPKWASSDFSGASDGTNGYYRDCIMDVLIMFLPPQAQAIIQASNGNHLVSYPTISTCHCNSKCDHDRVVIDPVVQELGTLMGERTSFPILCFEVLAAHVSNLRRCGDVRPLDQILKGVRINGDDRLAISTTALEEEFWEFCEKYLGFKESKGKSYTHTDYANINSQSYVCNVLSGTPYKIPVRASGLEHGQKKLDEAFDPTSVINQILDGCHNSNMEWTVLQRYLHEFERPLDQILAGRNLFVHPSLGGLGARPPCRHGNSPCRLWNGQKCRHLDKSYRKKTGGHWQIKVTLPQRFVAGALLQQEGAFALPYGPGPIERPSLPQLFETPWDVYGKPTYWNSEEFELKEMENYFQKVLGAFDPKQGHALPSVDTLLRSRLRLCAGGGDLLVKSSVREVACWKCPECSLIVPQARDCPCGWTRTAWQCSTCEMWNPECGMACRVCSEFTHPIRLVEKYSRSALTRIQTTPRNQSLSRSRVERLGYSVTQDEFDHSLFAFAIECARTEHEDFPTVRFKGRAIDLWGSDSSWAPLRASELVWSY